MSDIAIRPFNKEVKDLRGHKYGMLTVLEYAGLDKQHRSLWRCRCDCGAEIVTRGTTMRSGWKKSCGCSTKKWISEARTTHGMTNSREFKIWCCMKARTSSTRSKEYPRYGGRGIKMCQRWRDSFADFLSDMGPSPSLEHSIDRINNDGDYTLENCRWATRLEQAGNRRDNVMCICNGTRTHLTGAARMLGKYFHHPRMLVEKGLVTLCE